MERKGLLQLLYNVKYINIFQTVTTEKLYENNYE